MSIFHKVKAFLKYFWPRKKNVFYGVRNKAIPLSPVIFIRNPTPQDKAEIGQYWINKKDVSVYVYCGSKTWKKIEKERDEDHHTAQPYPRSKTKSNPSRNL